jgi:hypothetical protein
MRQLTLKLKTRENSCKAIIVEKLERDTFRYLKVIILFDKIR